MSKPSAPAQPNYTQAAQAQGSANVDTARTQAQLSNPSVINPYGSHQVVNGALLDPNAPNGQYRTSGNPDNTVVIDSLSPQGQQLFNTQNQIYQGLGSLGLSDLGRVSNSLGQPFDTSQLPQQINNIGGTPFQHSVNDPSLQTGYNVNQPVQYSSGFASPISQGYNSGGNVQYGNSYNQPIQSQISNAGGIQNSIDYNGQLQNGINTSGVSGIPQVSDQARTSASNAAYQQATSRLDPQWQQAQTQQETQLVNQGLRPGTEAYDTAMGNFNRAKNDAYQTAQNNSNQQGLLAQQAQFGMGLQANQTGFGEAQSQGQFANQTQAQAFQQAAMSGQFSNAAQQQAFAQNQAQGSFANSAQNQGFNQSQTQQAAYNAAQQQANQQGLQAAQFGNAAQGQGYAQAQGNLSAYNAAQQQDQAQAAAQAGFYNQAAGQQFGQGQQNANLFNNVAQNQWGQTLQSANLTNQGRQNALQEQLSLRQLPLNELTALMSGSQVNVPQFQGYQGANIQPAPFFGAAQAQAQGANNLYSNQVAQSNSFNSGLADMGAAAITAFSDLRLKSNIVRIGTHPLGIGIYEYDIFDRRERGVIAQEVQTVMPEAVLPHPSGYLMVDYGRL